MTPEQRKQLEERREFNKARVAARTLRERAQPAFGALSGAGVDFNLYPLGEEPRWLPDWVPDGWGRMHWEWLDNVDCTPSSLHPEELAPLVIAQMRTVMGPTDRVMVGSQFWLEMPFAAFEEHYLAIHDAMWGDAYVVSPPAQWLLELKGHRAWWKMG